ncbi:SapC family protein [Mesorhizobium sp. M1338]|uniref:SapC family protein n=1 Tax=unclassified Mesorhizobium TaxID=325217 RepID=UPI0033388806
MRSTSFTGIGIGTEATRQALAFRNRFQIDFSATRAMIERIDARGLFSPRQSKVTLEGGEELNLTDFQVIDEPAFNKLSDEAFLDLRKLGALGLLYCHLASTSSWPRWCIRHRCGKRTVRRAPESESRARTG